mmetsp:Transcript_7077/g.20862  ORF Transcript_7077/g.20862 Transcript_7077/m.20862 type:complete len:276 (-) Transcript_7077:171-998(-)|eukprot:CAMPEP_0119553762 /NCGR_PEP_ID=MMETSP1352-20130426/6429_1 /TAXON_ID=265584 /ORGANISM="Stauroneis constricta, Strain CCMP1120" /LENGTH=275 /DNA_ID=CAMNT_0007600227 /DNA_START=206 /DNA_END=1033 /DNA_ORIENTATION=+
MFFRYHDPFVIRPSLLNFPVRSSRSMWNHDDYDDNDYSHNNDGLVNFNRPTTLSPSLFGGGNSWDDLDKFQGTSRIVTKNGKKTFHFTMDLPGVKVDDIDIKFNDGSLHISAVRNVVLHGDGDDNDDNDNVEDSNSNNSDKKKRSQHRSTVRGMKKFRMQRSIQLNKDHDIDVSKLTANLDSGVLTITAPIVTKENGVIKVKVTTTQPNTTNDTDTKAIEDGKAAVVVETVQEKEDATDDAAGTTNTNTKKKEESSKSEKQQQQPKQDKKSSKKN